MRTLASQLQSRSCRHLLISLLLFAAASCSESDSPTAPTPGTPPPVDMRGHFVGNIMDADTRRECIDDARAEIIAGPSSGNVYPQDSESCEDPGAGFVIYHLPVGAVVTLRASAPGYVSVELDFVARASTRSVDINLKRAG